MLELDMPIPDKFMQDQCEIRENVATQKDTHGTEKKFRTEFIPMPDRFMRNQCELRRKCCNTERYAWTDNF